MKNNNLLPVLFVALIAFTACNKEEELQRIPVGTIPWNIMLYIVDESGEDLLDKSTEGCLLGDNRGADVRAIYNGKQYPVMLKDDICREDTLYSRGYLYYMQFPTLDGTTSRNRLHPFYVCQGGSSGPITKHYMHLGTWSKGSRWIDKEIVLDWGKNFKRDTISFTWYNLTQEEKESLGMTHAVTTGPLSLKFNGKEVTNRQEGTGWYIIVRK